MDAFDADVLIYAASLDHDLGKRVRPLIERGGVGSVLLEPETLAKPARDGRTDELLEIARLLVCLELAAVDARTARVATAVASKYRLKPIDAVHLATAVRAGADRFITNNRRDFDAGISEIDVVFAGDLS